MQQSSQQQSSLISKQSSSQQLKYTVVPIQQKQHQIKLQKYLSQDNDHLKTSYCRFYLRGNCIMKQQYCKFAHSFQQLKIIQDDRTTFQYFSTQKQRRKKQFVERKDFNQKALFFVKNFDYMTLYQYQFSKRYMKRKEKQHSLKDIKDQSRIRQNIRQVLHRQNWQKLVLYLIDKYPNVDFSVSFLSYWFQKVGFAKPQSRCKFGDFMRYMIFVMGFKEVQIVMPPRKHKMLFFINSKNKNTFLQKQLQHLVKQLQQQRQEQKKKQQITLKELPTNLKKKYICRYYMAGNCTDTSQTCYYAHSIDQLNFQKDQTFPKQYRQPTKSVDFRLNYTQVYLYAQKKGLKENLNQINSNLPLRNKLRNQMHQIIYKDFVNMLLKIYDLQYLTMPFLQKQYNSAGFNHTDQNKFQQLVSVLWEIGFHVQQVLNPNTRKKSTNIYKIPEIKVLDKYFYNVIKTGIENQFERVSATKAEDDQGLVLESAIKRNIYSMEKQFPIPLHTYLRLKQCNFQKVIEDWYPQQSKGIFFETSQQNLKKLSQIVKKYFKQRKKYIHKMEEIQGFVKEQHQSNINLNHFINFRQHIQSSVLECGKKIFFWPFGSSTIAVDKGCFGVQQKAQAQYKNRIKKIIYQIPILNQKQTQLFSERIIIIDDLKTFEYASKIMFSTLTYGMDIEGKLTRQGKIDLIQFSVKTKVKLMQKGEQNEVKNIKQIYIFDLFKISKQSKEKNDKMKENQQLWSKVVLFLKLILQDENRVKILHDCRQDSVALYYVLGISIKNVFDTSGTDIYLKQKEILKQKLKLHQIIKHIHEVKVPGLNNILDEYEAPNGINIFKDDMKKKFLNEKREYFQQRPIDPQFLEYSAQDVEDLIQVYQVMKNKDTDLMSRYIGQIYSKVDIQKQKLGGSLNCKKQASQQTQIMQQLEAEKVLNIQIKQMQKQVLILDEIQLTKQR